MKMTDKNIEKQRMEMERLQLEVEIMRREIETLKSEAKVAAKENKGWRRLRAESEKGFSSPPGTSHSTARPGIRVIWAGKSKMAGR
ncbi:hypothetical protein B0T14DRAFT_531437 [Immersiella caudata]|uniref:Uncharacterized protein n=1 Tax=Immersiella caudata TaxID=314043 RepID=A0AA39TYQ4_9PEZI|nr:hypothetical protein B0T14DRAFT_531437 [Immersiella caudata]